MTKKRRMDFESAAFWRKAALGAVILFLVFAGLMSAGLHLLGKDGGAGLQGLINGGLDTGTRDGFGVREILFLLGTLCVTNWLRMHRYVLFANALKLRVPVKTMYLYFLAGMALLPTPGKVGIALRVYLLKRRFGYPYRRTAPMLLMDGLTDGLAMLIMVSVALWMLGGAAGMGLAVLALAGIMGGLGALIWWPALLRAVVKFIYKTLGKKKPRLFAGALRMMRVVRTLFGGRVLFMALGFSLASWIVLALALNAVWGAEPLSVPVWVLAVCGGMVAGLASLMPGGMGGSEAGMVGVMTLLGVPLTQALMLTLAVRVMVFWLPVVVGWLILPFALRD